MTHSQISEFRILWNTKMSILRFEEVIPMNLCEEQCKDQYKIHQEETEVASESRPECDIK